jgi:hypothetical protein
MKFRSATLAILLLMLQQSDAQKSTASIQQVWLGYFNQTRISEKFGSLTDLHLRTKEDFFSNYSQSILRAGLTYYVTDNTKFTAGYTYVSIKKYFLSVY